MDLNASGTNPGTTYTIFPITDPGVYHEDRMVVTEVAPSTYVTQMFRVYGAAFTPGVGWDYVGATTAYATVQNPDGSIHYFSYSGSAPWLTPAWQGSGNNTIYNAVDYGLNTAGSGNNTALNLLFSALNSALSPALIGGSVRIPQYNFPVVAVIPSGATNMGIIVPDQVIIQGLGTGGEGMGGSNYHFTITDPGGAASSSFRFAGEFPEPPSAGK